MKPFASIVIHCLLAGVLLAASGRIARGDPRPPSPLPALAAAGVLPGDARADPPCVRVDLVGLGTLLGAVASLVLACGKAADLVIRAWRGDPPPQQSG